MKVRFLTGGVGVITDEDKGYYYIWWRGVHCLMGDEGFKAGLYIVRASEPGPRFDIPRFHFMVGGKAVVQDNGDNDWHGRGSLDLSKLQELRDLGAKTRARWQKFGLSTEDHDNWDKCLEDHQLG